MNILPYAAVLSVGVLFGVAVVAIVFRGKAPDDTERLDLIQQQGLSLFPGEAGTHWGVVAHGALLGSGGSAREAIDKVLATKVDEHLAKSA